MSTIPEPTLRDAPPWAMQDMIEAEPELAYTILGDKAAADLGRAVASDVEGGPASVVGCGSSEHGAMAVASLLEEGLRAGGAFPPLISARQAFEAALDPWPVMQLLAVSHEGETSATLAALEAVKVLDPSTNRALITANPSGPIAKHADYIVATPVLDRSWCHTVGYLSPVLVGLAAGLAIAREPFERADVANGLQAIIDERSAGDPLVAGLRGASSFIVVGSGVDAISARELALKIEEGARLPAVARDTETELHGHLVSARSDTAVIALINDPRRTEARAKRAAGLLLAARRLGMPTVAILSTEANAHLPSDATSSGRWVLSPLEANGPVLQMGAALTSAAVALQLLTLGLLMHHGRNPDLIGRENADQREAADVAGQSFPLPTSL